MGADKKVSGPVDVLNKAATYASHAAIAAERIGNGEVEDMDGVRQAFLRITAGLSGAAEASAAVAELIDAAANVVADIRANKEPDLIALADCIKAAGGRDVLKAALSKVEGKAYTLAALANVGSAS